MSDGSVTNCKPLILRIIKFWKITMCVTICHILPDSWKPIEEIKKIMNLLWNSGSSVCVSKNVIGYHHVYSSKTNSLREFLIFMINAFMYYVLCHEQHLVYSLSIFSIFSMRDAV